MRVDLRPGLLMIASLLAGGCSLVVDFDRSLLADGGSTDGGSGGEGGAAGEAGADGVGGRGGAAGQGASGTER